MCSKSQACAVRLKMPLNVIESQAVFPASSRAIGSPPDSRGLKVKGLDLFQETRAMGYQNSFCRSESPDLTARYPDVAFNKSRLRGEHASSPPSGRSDQPKPREGRNFAAITKSDKPKSATTTIIQ
jgi:hypothetical protein